MCINSMDFVDTNLTFALDTIWSTVMPSEALFTESVVSDVFVGSDVKSHRLAMNTEHVARYLLNSSCYSM